MQNMLKLIGRNQELFEEDIKEYDEILKTKVSESSFLVIGGAGSIGQAVTKRFSSVIQKNCTLSTSVKTIWSNWYETSVVHSAI